MRTFIVNKSNRLLHQSVLSAVFRQRKELFVDRLGWSNMVVTDGGERDEADTDPDVTYLVTVSDTNLLIGSCRLTPSMGKCLLGAALSNYLDDQIERLETSWELTRFAPATNPSDPHHGHSFALLATGVLEWALGSGVDKVFGIAEPPLMAIAGGLGWRVKIEGPPVEYEPGKSAFAFSFPVDEATLQSTRSAFRLRGRVLSDPFEKDEVAA
jgi:N-acyl-L-homoserine lactone synthetase